MNKWLLLFMLPWTTLQASKPELWQTMKQPLGENFAFRQQYRVLLSEFKTLDARISLYYKRELWKNLEGEVHYTFIANRPRDQTLFEKIHRLELELNPRFEIAEGVYFKFRNRYELLKFEDENRLAQRFRQRQELTFKVGKKCVKDISISNEILYDIDTRKVFEYRLIPLEIKVDLPGKHAYIFYAMIRWRATNPGWDPQYVWGSTLEW